MDQQVLQQSPNNDQPAIVVAVNVPIPVEVPVPIPVQVPQPVEVPVAVPVYVPAPDSETVERQLKEQYHMQNEQMLNNKFQESNYNNISNSPYLNMNNNNNNNNSNNNEANQVQELQKIENVINDGTQQIKDKMNSGLETIKDKLSYNNETNEQPEEIKKPESAIFSEAKQPLTGQALEQEDKKEVTNIKPNENIKPPNIEINQLHDIKKEHKDINRIPKTENENEKEEVIDLSLGNVINVVTEGLSNSVDKVKYTLGLNNHPKPESAIFDQAKQPLVGQALESEDKKEVKPIVQENNDARTGSSNFEINEMYDVKKEHKDIGKSENKEKEQGSLLNQVKDTLNNSVESIKTSLKMNNNNIKKPESNIFSEAKQPLTGQALEKEDKKEIKPIVEGTNYSGNTSSSSNFDINEMHDVKKEHKDNTLLENKRNNEKKQGNLLNQVKDTLNNSVENVKSSLKMNNNDNKKPESSVFSEAKQPLSGQALEKEDIKDVKPITATNTSNGGNFEVNELYDIKKEHKNIDLNDNNNNKNQTNLLTQVKDKWNDSVDTMKQSWGLNQKESRPESTIFQQSKKPLVEQALEREDLKNTIDVITPINDDINLDNREKFVGETSRNDTINKLNYSQDISNENSSNKTDKNLDKNNNRIMEDNKVADTVSF